MLLLIDNDVEGNATEKARHLEKRLRLEDGMVYNMLTRFPLVCVRNFNTGKLVPKSQHGKDCFTREKDFIDENGLGDLRVKFGQFELIQQINEKFIPVHFHNWKKSELAKLEIDRQEKATKLDNLGQNPAHEGFHVAASKAYKEKVVQAVGVLAETGEGGRCRCLSIVQEVGIDSPEFPDKLSTAIKDNIVAAVGSAVDKVQGEGNMNLQRFAEIVKGPYETEAKHKVDQYMESNDFKKKCSEKVDVYRDMAMFLYGDNASARMKKNAEVFFSNLAKTDIFNPVRCDLEADHIGVLSGVDFTQEDSRERKKLKDSLEIIDSNIALLNRLPDPPASPTVDENPTAGSLVNRNDEHDSDENGDGNAPNNDRRKDDGNSTDDANHPPSDDNNGSGGSGGNGGGAGGKPSYDKKEDTLCSLAALESGITSPRAVSEQSPSDEGDNSDSSESSEDVDDDVERTACKQHKSGQGRDISTPKKLSRSTGTSGSTKRKQNGAGGSSKQLPKRSKKEKKDKKIIFGVGTKLESDFTDGWYKGEIIRKEGKKYVVEYSDGEVTKYTHEQLISQRCHRIVDVTSGTLV